MKVDPTTAANSIKVKLFKSVFTDNSVINNFLLKTPKGNEEINKYNYLCVGEDGAVCQRTFDELHALYNFRRYDGDMWEIYTPKLYIDDDWEISSIYKNPDGN